MAPPQEREKMRDGESLGDFEGSFGRKTRKSGRKSGRGRQNGRNGLRGWMQMGASERAQKTSAWAEVRKRRAFTAQP